MHPDFEPLPVPHFLFLQSANEHTGDIAMLDKATKSLLDKNYNTILWIHVSWIRLLPDYYAYRL
jgi:hypothetical protein